MHTLSTVSTLAGPGGPARPALRPVRPDDLPAMRRFVQSLDADTRRLRFHGGVNPASPRLLQHLTQDDGTRHIAVVAVLACDDSDLIVGEARCVRAGAGDDRAEFAITVAEAWRGCGLATALMLLVEERAAEAGIGTLAGEVLRDNARMAGLLQRLGYAPCGAAGSGAAETWVRAVACRLQACVGAAAPGAAASGAAAGADRGHGHPAIGIPQRQPCGDPAAIAYRPLHRAASNAATHARPSWSPLGHTP
jgi:GNAT superfamily N-acetyltransferase